MLERGFGPRADVEHLERARPGEVAALDVAHGVAARLTTRQAHRGEIAEQLRNTLELYEVELHVLPGGQVTPAAGVLVGDVAEHVELFGRDRAVGRFHAHHLVVAPLALAVDAVVQPEDAEHVLGEVAFEVAPELLFELRDVRGLAGIDLPLQHGSPSPRRLGLRTALETR